MFTQKQSPLPGKSLLFIALAYLFSWMVWMPALLSSSGLINNVPWPPLFAIGICGPLVSALCCIWWSAGWMGVKDWLKQGFTRRFHWGWWAFIVLTPFLVPALVWVAYTLSGGGPYSLPVFQDPWIILPTTLLMVTIGGGQEEYGWRGYLLPQLDSLWNPWKVDFFLIVVHSLWHLPLFFISATAQSSYPFWVFFVFGCGLTLIINRVYRSTGGSLLATILFHGMVNAGLEIFPPVGTAVGGANWPFLLAGLCYAVLTWIVRPRGKTQ